jgi:hypothetical protein
VAVREGKGSIGEGVADYGNEDRPTLLRPGGCATRSTSEREALEISGDYYSLITGELDESATSFQQEMASYPREATAYAELGLDYFFQGQCEKQVHLTDQAVRLAPDRVFLYGTGYRRD